MNRQDQRVISQILRSVPTLPKGYTLDRVALHSWQGKDPQGNVVSTVHDVCGKKYASQDCVNHANRIKKQKVA